ncbi:MAG: 30S ribosomal protein S17 [Patescibacteria group bacterium]
MITSTTTNTASKKRVLSGVVVSDKMKDTIVVSVERYVKVPKYNKYVTRTKKFKAHDAGNTKKIGDKVEIQECAPISKDKHFTLVK